MSKRLIYLGHDKNKKTEVYLGLLDVSDLTTREVSIKRVSDRTYTELKRDGVEIKYSRSGEVYVDKDSYICIGKSERVPLIAGREVLTLENRLYVVSMKGFFTGVYTNYVEGVEGLDLKRNADEIEYSRYYGPGDSGGMVEETRIRNIDDEKLVRRIKEVLLKDIGIRDEDGYIGVRQELLCYGVLSIERKEASDGDNRKGCTLRVLSTIEAHKGCTVVEGDKHIRVKLELPDVIEKVEGVLELSDRSLVLGYISFVGSEREVQLCNIRVQDINIAGLKKLKLGDRQFRYRVVNNSAVEILGKLVSEGSRSRKIDIDLLNVVKLRREFLESLGDLGYKRVGIDRIAGLECEGDLRLDSSVIVKSTIDKCKIGGTLEINTGLAIEILDSVLGGLVLRGGTKETRVSLRLAGTRVEGDVDLRAYEGIDIRGILQEGFDILGKVYIREDLKRCNIGSGTRTINLSELKVKLYADGKVPKELLKNYVKDLEVEVYGDNILFYDTNVGELRWYTEVESIKEDTFKYSNNYISNELASVRRVCSRAFRWYRCKELDLRNLVNLEVLEENAIEECRNLEVLMVGDNVKLEGVVVKGCKYLREFYIGKGVTGITTKSFTGLSGELKVYSEEMTPELEELHKNKRYKVIIGVGADEYYTRVDAITEELGELKGIVNLMPESIDTDTREDKDVLKDIRASMLLQGYSEGIEERYSIVETMKEDLEGSIWSSCVGLRAEYSSNTVRDRVLLGVLTRVYPRADYLTLEVLRESVGGYRNIYKVGEYSIVSSQVLKDTRGYALIKGGKEIVHMFTISVEEGECTELEDIIQNYIKEANDLSITAGMEPSKIMNYASSYYIKHPTTQSHTLTYTDYHRDISRDLTEEVGNSVLVSWLPFGVYIYAGQSKSWYMCGIDLATGDLVSYSYKYSNTVRKGRNWGTGSMSGISSGLAGSLEDLKGVRIGVNDNTNRRYLEAEAKGKGRRQKSMEKSREWLLQNKDEARKLYDYLNRNVSMTHEEFKSIAIKSKLYYPKEYDIYSSSTGDDLYAMYVVEDENEPVRGYGFTHAIDHYKLRDGDIVFVRDNSTKWSREEHGFVLMEVSSDGSQATTLLSRINYVSIIGLEEVKNLLQAIVDTGEIDTASEEYKEVTEISEEGFKQLDLIMLREFGADEVTGLSRLRLSYSKVNGMFCIHTDRVGDIIREYKGSLVYFWCKSLGRAYKVLKEIGYDVNKPVTDGWFNHVGYLCDLEGKVEYNKNTIGIMARREEGERKREAKIKEVRLVRKAILEGNTSGYKGLSKDFNINIYTNVCKQPKR